jgi:hypothetical protein
VKEQNEQKELIGMTKSLLALVAILAGVAYLSVFNPKAEGPSVANQSEAKFENSLDTARAPASNPVEEVLTSGYEVVDASMDINCSDAQKDYSIGASSVRLRLKSCRNFELSEITNTTNGFQATLFESESKMLTTDFIQLSIGANEIEVKNKDSAKDFKLKIVRMPASSQERSQD